MGHKKALRAGWFHGVMVSTLDSESSDPSSNLGGTCKSALNHASPSVHSCPSTGVLRMSFLNNKVLGQFFINCFYNYNDLDY